jgi:hypothetical protein
MSRTVRSLAVLVLALWFLAGTVPATAVPLSGSAAEESVWSAAWDWLVGLFAPSDAGCTIDPNGRPICFGPASNRDAGAAIDPDGSSRFVR